MDYSTTAAITFDSTTGTWTFGNDDVKNRREKKYSGAFDIEGKTVYIKEVIYSNPATIILWSDGERTVVKCSKSDCYSEEVGLVMCIMKRQMGSKRFKQLLSSWVPEVIGSFTPTRVRLSDVIKKEKHD